MLFRSVATICRRWPKLKSLSLIRLGVTDDGLAPLSGLSTLESLEIDQTPIMGAGLEHLHRLAKLRSTVLDGNRLKEAQLAQLGGVAGLTTLELHDKGLSDGAVPYLKWLSRLKRLALNRTQITDAGVNDLRHSLPFAEIIGGSLAATQEKLGRIGMAVHEYHSQHRHFPPAVLIGPDGKTPYSWRVALLPSLGEGKLFSQYHLDQPGESPHKLRVLVHIHEK